MAKGILLGILLGVFLVFAGVYFYFATGRAPVATKGPEMPFEHHMAHMAQDAYFAKMPHLPPAVPDNETTYLEGAKVYKESLCRLPRPSR